MADEVIKNLITQLSFDFDQKALIAFDKQLDSIKRKLTLLVGTVIAAAGPAGMTALAVSTAKAHDQMGKLDNITDLTLQTMQELGFVAENDGSSIDSMNSSMLNLSKIISETARGIGTGVEVFGILGLSVIDTNDKLKSADVLFNEISDSLLRLGTDAERLEFTRRLGFDDKLLNTLKRGSQGINQLRAEARELDFIIDKDATKAAAEFNKELLVSNKLMLGIRNVIGTNLVKQFIPLIQKFNEFTKANKDLIKTKAIEFFDKMQTIMQVTFNIGVRLVRIIENVAMAMGGWKSAIIGVTGVILAMNASALLLPLLAAASGIALLAIIEDLQKFSQGGESVIGNLPEDYENLRVVAEGVLATTKLIVEGWSKIFNPSESEVEGFKMLIEDIGTFINTWILDPLTKVFKLLDSIPGFDIPLAPGAQGATREELKEQLPETFEQGEVKFNKSGFQRLTDFFANIAFSPALTEGISEEVVLNPSGFQSLVDTLSSFAYSPNVSGVSSPNIAPVNNILNKSNSITNDNTRNSDIIININGGDTTEIRKTVDEQINLSLINSDQNVGTEVVV